MAVKIGLDDDGSLVVRDEAGNVVPDAVAKIAKKEAASSLVPWLQEATRETNAAVEACRTVHYQTPAPNSLDRAFLYQAFEEKPPFKPFPREYNFFQRLIPALRKGVDRTNLAAQELFESQMRTWEERKARHEEGQEARRKLFDEARGGSLERMEELLGETLSRLPWPRETSVNFQLVDNQTLLLDVDLPEIEDMPSKEAKMAARNDRLLIKELSETARRKNYMEHVHGIGFRLVGEAFSALPTLKTVVVSGYSQRLDKKTGHVNDEYLYSARVDRDAWSKLNFRGLVALDVIEAFTQFELRRNMTKTGVFKPIDPFQG